MSRPVAEPLEEIVRGLGFVALELAEGGRLDLVGSPPSWCAHYCPCPLNTAALPTAFPFLDMFLADAHRFWAEQGEGQLRSGAWVQTGHDGVDRVLEAEALKASGRRFLLIRMAGADWEERRNALQALRLQRLTSEQTEKRARIQTLEIQQRSREVERLNQLKSEFIASVSHELRTPLNAITGFSNLLARGKAGALNSKQEAYLTHIQKAATHLLEVVNDVIDLSRIESGSILIRREWFLAAEAVQEVLAVLRPLAHTSDVSFHFDAAGNERIFADRLRFKQILYNLLSNAVKFSPKKAPVTIALNTSGTDFEIAVSDRGVGIDSGEIAMIFDKYYQAPLPDGSTPSGSGLGLSIVKHLVELHGGKISVESTRGAGSRFEVRIPMAAAGSLPEEKAG